MKTFVDKLEEENVVENLEEKVGEKVEITKENVKDLVTNFELDYKIFVEAVNFYYTTYPKDIIELLQRFMSIYNMTESCGILEYIKHVCAEAEIPLLLRLELAKDMCSSKPVDACFLILEKLCRIAEKTTDITTTSLTSAIVVLFKNEATQASGAELFKRVIDKSDIECKYRYKLICGLKSFTKLQQEFHLHFLKKDTNEIMYRILAAQSLLSQHDFADAELVCNEVLYVCKNEDVEYNARADAADLLLRMGTPDMKILASSIIKDLGKVGTKHSFTMYENAQTAHTSSIEESAILILERLYELKFPIEDFQVCKKILLQYVCETKTQLIERVITRIELDNATYSKMNTKLSSVFCTICSFISWKNESVLFDRLISELSDCDGICSTGIFERIVNSISGFEDFVVGISIEEQIESNLFGRLNAKIAKLSSIGCLHSALCNCVQNSCFASKITSTNVRAFRRLKKCGNCACCIGVKCLHECGENCQWNIEFRDKAMEEILIPTSCPEKRTNFLRIYNLYISDIMEEMRDEFLEFIDEDTFAVFFRRAMMKYDCATR